MRGPLRSRVRRILTVALLATTATLIAVWVASGWFGVLRVRWPGNEQLYGIMGGAVGAMELEFIPAQQGSGQTGFDWGRLKGDTPEWMWWFHVNHTNAPGAVLHTWWMPLWVPVVAAGIPAAWMWRSERRERFGPGRCHKCGYSLAGLGAAAGRDEVCPECGAAVSKSRA